MTRRYQNIRMANKIVNLTGHEIDMYDEHTGEFLSFLPIDARTLRASFLDFGGMEDGTYYVVEHDMAKEIRKNGRALDDVAVVGSESVGRKNRIITYLVWAKDKKVSVRVSEASTAV